MATRGWDHITHENIGKLVKQPAQHKYHANRTTVDGISFMSKAEANRYSHLRLLEKAGQIHELTRQPRFDLHLNGARLGVVIFDFKYRTGKNSEWIIEDVKGYEDNKMPATLYSRWKRRHFELEYGMSVQIVK